VGVSPGERLERCVHDDPWSRMRRILPGARGSRAEGHKRVGTASLDRLDPVLTSISGRSAAA
jgi:hypothetical protein